MIKGEHQFLVNGVRQNIPYKLPGLKVINIGGLLVFGTSFGLTVVWDGDARVQVLLCDAYRKYVCGLCGNADGRASNDYVDRYNKRVPLKGSRYVKYFKWGSKWRVRDKSTKDSVCDPRKSPGTIKPPKCKNIRKYKGKKYCGFLLLRKGPFKFCRHRALLGRRGVVGIYRACLFDMCAMEGSKTQEELRCKIMEAMDTQCRQAADDMGLRRFNMKWRKKARCLKKCAKNEVFELRRGCPNNCLQQKGKIDCGLRSPIQGCYCKKGYLRNAESKCVKRTQCGCKHPNKRSIIKEGQEIESKSCRLTMFCRQGKIGIKYPTNHHHWHQKY
jgi:hypothetical protein